GDRPQAVVGDCQASRSLRRFAPRDDVWMSSRAKRSDLDGPPGRFLAPAPDVQPTTPPRRPGPPARPDSTRVVWPRRPKQRALVPPPPPAPSPGATVPPLPPAPEPYFDWHRAARVGALIIAALLVTGGVAWTRCGIR